MTDLYWLLRILNFCFLVFYRFLSSTRIATALASYRIGNPRNPENRQTNRPKIGTSYFLLIFLVFSAIFPICFLFVLIFSGFGVFLFCSWPTQSQRRDPYEQRHFYVKKAKTEFATFVWKTAKRDIRLKNEIGSLSVNSPALILSMNSGVFLAKIGNSWLKSAQSRRKSA